MLVVTLWIACARSAPPPSPVAPPPPPPEPTSVVWCWRLAEDGKVLAGCSTTSSLCEQRTQLMTTRYLDPAANARAQSALEPCVGVVEPWTTSGRQLFQVLRDEQTCLEFVGRPLPEFEDTVCRPATAEDLARLRANESGW
jgi:hypothetical protein